MVKDAVEWETHFSSKEETKLRTDLIALQNKIRQANVPVYIVLCGVSGAGKFGTMFLLRDWLDQRSVGMNAYEREEFPNAYREYLRYWNDNVLNGEIGVFLRSWYSNPLIERSLGKIDDKALYKRLDLCRSFEKTLADNGAIICKIWFYKSKKEQEAYLHTLDEMDYERWRIMESDWKNCALADDFEKTSKKIVEYTDTSDAPWFAVRKGLIPNACAKAWTLSAIMSKNRLKSVWTNAKRLSTKKQSRPKKPILQKNWIWTLR